VLEEENAALTQQLPADLVADWVFVFASGLDCRLVVE
jgi:hypothetical protein